MPESMMQTLVPLVDDLSRELPDGERYRRLLHAVRALLPCDAAALLRLEGSWLVPLAVDGLSSDTLGRRFKIDEHPRFSLLLQAAGPTRFAADSPLPDPYDGLVEGLHGLLQVHDCMGCPVRIGEKTWGLLTIDALGKERFSAVALNELQAFASLAAATVSVVQRMDGLALRAQAERQRADRYRALAAEKTAPPTLMGQSAAHQRLLEEIASVGNSDLTVLLTGETGVGKELVAQALHAASPRAARPLISLNCAALPETLVESELFGHVRGAFSGAVAERRGKFELADGGTLFLDEVGELSLAVQAKLLRVLQGGQLQRLGSDREHRVDVRVIAATNRDLAQEVRAGRYRADFYHRLTVYPLVVPPLRERGDDVLVLAGCFLEQNRSRLGLNGLRLAADAQAALLAHDWPGNVRELEHLISRSALKALAGHKGRPRMVSLTARHLDLPGLSDLRGLPNVPAWPNAQAAPQTPEMSTVADDSVTGAVLVLTASAVRAAADTTATAASAAGRAPEGQQATPAVTATAATPAAGDGGDLRSSTEAHQRQRIQACLAQHQGNWASAARALGLHRANLVRLAKRLGMATQAVR